MTSILKELRDMGTPWVIYKSLTASVDLAVAKYLVTLPPNIGNTNRRDYGERVVICGFAYSFEAANGNGFDIVRRDTTFTPAASTNFVLFGDRCTTAITSKSFGVERCFIPLPVSRSTPDSTYGDDLAIVTTATGPTRGNILIWGVLMPSNERLVANQTSGSPFDMNVSPPN